ncbi:MAG: hypothetical protein AAFV53_36100 [Myxococcota bacterium]
MKPLDPTDRVTFPDLEEALAVVRSESQRWERKGFAEGELILGYGIFDDIVRVEFHWWRFFSRSHRDVNDVYTGELWAKRPAGDWLYLMPQKGEQKHVVPHDALAALLEKQLDVHI